MIQENLSSQEQPLSTENIRADVAERPDPCLREAAEIIWRKRRGLPADLQRSNLAVGFHRASRILNQLEDAGIVGPVSSSAKPGLEIGPEGRELLVANRKGLQTLLNKYLQDQDSL